MRAVVIRRIVVAVPRVGVARDSRYLGHDEVWFVGCMLSGEKVRAVGAGYVGVEMADRLFQIVGSETLQSRWGLRRDL